MVRLLDMVNLLVNLKLPSLVNKANLSLVSSRNKLQLRLSRLGKGCKGVKPA